MVYQSFTLKSFDSVNKKTADRLHNLGLCKGSKIKVIQRYPFHGPIIVESDNQRIGLRYRVFVALTGAR